MINFRVKPINSKNGLGRLLNSCGHSEFSRITCVYKLTYVVCCILYVVQIKMFITIKYDACFAYPITLIDLFKTHIKIRTVH